MENWTIYLILACIIGLSIYSTVRLVQLDGETNAFLYQRASKINPSCANFCAELDWFEENSTQGRECLKELIERGHCRK